MTDEEKKDYHDRIDQNIKKFGYHMTFVFSDKSPSYCYSTGIYKNFNIPELFISSLPQNLSFEVIENYVEQFKGANKIPTNQQIGNLTDRFPVYLIDVPINNLKEYVLSSIRFYKGDNFNYIQLIYPDTKGHFPNETGYDYDQEIFGNFPFSYND